MVRPVCIPASLFAALIFAYSTAAVPQGFFVGTYSSHILSYIAGNNVSNVANAPLQLVDQTTSGPSPSWLATDPRSRFLFAVNEAVASVSSLRIDKSTGALELLNSVPSGGGAPCHISVDPNSRFVLVSNYCGGSISILPIFADGRLGAARTYAQDNGSGASSCAGPSHVHQSIILGSDSSSQVALVVDLGMARILRFEITWDADRLPALSAQTTVLQLPAESGPRHVELHPWLPVAYVLDELQSELVLCRIEGINAASFQPIAVVSTLRPHAQAGGMAAAEVETDGWHVFVSNRDRTAGGRDSIVIFDIEQSTGNIAGRPQHFSSLGQEPRFFALYPLSKQRAQRRQRVTSLLVANQKGNSIAEFAVKENGALELRVITRDVRSPSHILAARFEDALAIGMQHGDALLDGGGSPALRGRNSP